VAEDDPWRAHKKLIAVNRFCGCDYVMSGLADMALAFHRRAVPDTAALPKSAGRVFQDEHTGPIMSWEDLERFPWPDPAAPAATRDLEWFQKNLPEDMCIIGGLTGHFAEDLSWLMGYETLCFALHDQPDLVAAVAERLTDRYRAITARLLEFDRVKCVWGSDDMGFKTGLLISPDDTRRLVLPGHKLCAEMAHEAGRPYLLHSCGRLTDIIDDLIDDVKIDAKHSYEDTIEDVREVKGTYGRRIALLGGIDVDFLCRAGEEAIRRRVRQTLEVCQGGGGYCLGTGNSVANYIPLDNYLAMVDEGMLYGT
jgi:uroporphyrinogen decarboxylase